MGRRLVRRVGRMVVVRSKVDIYYLCKNGASFLGES